MNQKVFPNTYLQQPLRLISSQGHTFSAIIKSTLSTLHYPLVFFHSLMHLSGAGENLPVRGGDRIVTFNVLCVRFLLRVLSIVGSKLIQLREW
jgi:hypothetical protein